MSTIITRNSATSGSIPSSLVQGELAINVTDGKLFYGSGSGNIVKEFTVSSSRGQTFPYTGSALITGSLGITGSLSVIDGTGINNLNTSTRILYSSNSTASLSWDDRALYSSNGINILSWRTLRAFDTSTTRSIDWGARTLHDTGAFTSLDWSGRKLLDTQSTGVVSVDWRNRLLHDTFTSQSLDWTNRIQIDTSGITSTAWEVRRHYDTSTSQSINWGSRDLTDINESASLNWDSRLMRDSGAPGGSGFPVSSINWESREAQDNVGNSSINWDTRNLFDGSANPSINWASRTQYDQSGNAIIDYSGNNGLNILNYRPTLEISNPTSQDEFIAITTGIGSIASNFAGNLIEVDTNIDLAVTASNTVFLDTDGIWKLTNQSTDNTIKLLGICVNGYSRGTILTEGIVTVTTSSGIVDVPFISGSSFYGMPVYLTGSIATFTTDKPTSGYVRVIGHMYYNSPTNPDYWIMKFNPSNDWYEI